jgi:dTDP-3-amino-2,3,6-trideoxy-4-keto-D-glucose/dTDP-3-amino-3,4,6-trideoxy-alpha-D-glucose/dTDP-2,6-dideoxy-D-kanosamine transaminase
LKNNLSRIDVWSYLEEYKKLRSKILKSVDKVFKSGQLILGNEVLNLEKKFSQYTSNQYGVGVNSGTDALQIILMALDIQKDDEIITTSNTAVPTVSAIVSSGAKPVFVDINECDYLINCEKVEKKINKKTKAIIAVNLYGQCADYKSLIKISKKYNIMIIEDCAQSTGALYMGKPSGSFGAMSAFSFYPTKNLGAYGDGGMIVTNKKKYYEKCKKIRKYGMSKLYYSDMHGINSRLDEVQAAIINLKISYLDETIKRRRKIALRYNNEIKNTDLILPRENKDCYHSFYVYVVRHKKRNSIMQYLKKNGVFCNISYPFPIHLMKGYKYLGYKKNDLPVTELMSKQIFSLPMYPQLTMNQLDKVIKLINNY